MAKKSTATKPKIDPHADGENYTADGCWIKTWKGLKFSYTDPQPAGICIEDIAHHLSLCCRFACATGGLYSVAEHSVRVAVEVCGSFSSRPDVVMAALLHDAHEAYTGDVPRPLKALLAPLLKPIETKIQTAILKSLKIPPIDYELYKFIKKVDEKLLATEGRDLMQVTNGDWPGLPVPIGGWSREDYHYRVDPLVAEQGEQLFLMNYRRLATDIISGAEATGDLLDIPDIRRIHIPLHVW